MTNLDLMLMIALDEVEELRQKLAEGPLDDYDLRVAAANIASLMDDVELHNRANWTDMLKKNEDSKYHKRYYEGPFHI